MRRASLNGISNFENVLLMRMEFIFRTHCIKNKKKTFNLLNSIEDYVNYSVFLKLRSKIYI